jgi:HAD superfamily 5'-nucleotidase-like hydrolase
MCKKLVEKKGYPKSILNLKLEYDRAIRGLVIDKARGNLLKLSRHTAIRLSYHGLEKIHYSKQNQIYKSTYIDIKDKSYDKVDTSFSISFAALFAQLVDLKEGSEKKYLPEFITIAEDLNEVLDEAHRDGSLKNVVRSDLSRFIVKDKGLVQGLEKYIKHQKKFFIVTNSDFDYAKLLLEYAIDPFLKGNKNWQDIFKYVIVSAKKPGFFFNDTPFQKIDESTGKMSAFSGPLVPGTYADGNANQFTSDLGLHAEEILYIGDHIYGDIVRLKKDCAWRTALVVEELEQEIKSLKKVSPYINTINSLMNKKIPLEYEIDRLISHKIESARFDKSTGRPILARKALAVNSSGQSAAQHDEPLRSSLTASAEKHSAVPKTALDKKINLLIKRSSDIDKKIGPLIGKQDKMFNPYWGELMRVGIEESYFAYQVERFACVYMARLSDLLKLSPRTYYRSAKRALPHELI